MAHRRAFCAVLVAVLGLVSSGCGGSDYHYIKNSSARSYLRVPDSWQLFDEDAIVTELSVPAESQSAFKDLTWSVAFDAAPTPSLAHLLSPSAHPAGIVQTRTLQPAERDRFSLADLRELFLETDPLSEEGVANGMTVVAAQEVSRSGGLHGSDFTVNIRTATGEYVTYRQVGLIDAGARHVHLLAVTCATPCFQKNEKVIDRVIDSWIVKER